MIKNHPFVDGNKRTAVAAAGCFLKLNGRRLTASNEDLVRFVLRVAAEETALEELVDWLRAHASSS